jgi:hypothetical protein
MAKSQPARHRLVVVKEPVLRRIHPRARSQGGRRTHSTHRLRKNLDMIVRRRVNKRAKKNTVRKIRLVMILKDMILKRKNSLNVLPRGHVREESAASRWARVGRLRKRYTPPLFILMQIMRHLRTIRFPKVQGTTQSPVIGFDFCHEKDDPLWDNQEVLALLKRRCKRSKSAERQAKRASNKEYYKRKREKDKAMLERNKVDLAAGAITEAAAKERLGKLGIGWLKWKCHQVAR